MCLYKLSYNPLHYKLWYCKLFFITTSEKQNESHSETNGINCCEDQEKCSNCDTASKDCAEACGVSCEPTDDEVSKQTSATGISLSQNKSLGPHDTSDNLSSDALGKQSTTSTIKDCENSQLRYTSVASNDHSTCGADEAAVFDHEASGSCLSLFTLTG